MDRFFTLCFLGLLLVLLRLSALPPHRPLAASPARLATQPTTPGTRGQVARLRRWLLHPAHFTKARVVVLGQKAAPEPTAQ